jgi:hypothetical protein
LPAASLSWDLVGLQKPGGMTGDMVTIMVAAAQTGRAAKKRKSLLDNSDKWSENIRQSV